VVALRCPAGSRPGARHSPWQPAAVETRGPDTPAEGLTDQQGRFIIPALAPGQYLVVAVAAGYDPQGAVVAVSAGQATEVHFRLLPLRTEWATIQGTVAAALSAGDGEPPPLPAAFVWLESRGGFAFEVPVVGAVLGGHRAKPLAAEISPRAAVRLPRLCALTDDAGHFLLMAPPGRHSLWARHEGCLPARRVVEVPRRGMLRADLRLPPALLAEEGAGQAGTPPGPPPPPPTPTPPVPPPPAPQPVSLPPPPPF
jgi:hypothetical protein